MIIDGHAHVTDADYGAPDLLMRCMASTGIARAVLVPGGMIDVRDMTGHLTGRSLARTDDIPNHLVERLVREYPHRFYGFYCVNPHRGDVVVAEFEQAVRRGFSGLKLAPVVHRFALTARTVLDLAALCGDLGVPFYTHVVYSPGASTEKAGILAREFPGTTFILGHMGFGPADLEAVDLAGRYDNLYLETSGGSFLGIKTALERLGPGKIIYGSEFPLHHPKVELEKLRLLTDGDAFDQVAGLTLLALLPPRVPR
jgi:predicted TIM-barrel fold metal-dependent hydrolase